MIIPRNRKNASKGWQHFCPTGSEEYRTNNKEEEMDMDGAYVGERQHHGASGKLESEKGDSTSRGGSNAS